MSMIVWILLGLVLGFIASKIVSTTGEGTVVDILLGTVGAIVELKQKRAAVHTLALDTVHDLHNAWDTNGYAGAGFRLRFDHAVNRHIAPQVCAGNFGDVNRHLGLGLLFLLGCFRGPEPYEPDQTHGHAEEKDDD